MATTAPPSQSTSKQISQTTALQQQSSAQRVPQLAQPHTGLRTPSNRKTIYDRNLNRTRTAELSRASFAYLFGEMVGYAQKRVTGIQDLERRYIPHFLASSIQQLIFNPGHNDTPHTSVCQRPADHPT